MKYVDNLIDWADSLFTEFTMESVNEATLLYVMAQEILGPRPADIGRCGEATENSRTYATIAPLIKTSSDFLVGLETSTIVVTKTGLSAAKSETDSAIRAAARAGEFLPERSGEPLYP